MVFFCKLFVRWVDRRSGWRVRNALHSAGRFGRFAARSRTLLVYRFTVINDLPANWQIRCRGTSSDNNSSNVTPCNHRFIAGQLKSKWNVVKLNSPHLFAQNLSFKQTTIRTRNESSSEQIQLFRSANRLLDKTGRCRSMRNRSRRQTSNELQNDLTRRILARKGTLC